MDDELGRLREINAALLAAVECQLAWDDFGGSRFQAGAKFREVLTRHGWDGKSDTANFTLELTRDAYELAMTTGGKAR